MVDKSLALWFSVGMKLETYLHKYQLSIGEFAKALGLSHEAVRRYLRMGRIPEPSVMRLILAATKGRVKPNDFYQ